MVVLYERNLPYPLFPSCNMLVPWCALKKIHLATAQYARGKDQKRRWLEEEELKETSERSFQAYEEPLENMTTFRYL